MRKQQHTAGCPEQYLTAIGLDPDKVIYFDIETTGFRASTSQLYMIGWAVRGSASSSGDKCSWEVTQLLAENASEELPMLKLFCEILRRYSFIVEFNGDRFDLPYLREKCAIYKMADPFEGMQTVDLYQVLRPCRSLLGMSKLNQKSVEEFLHITREDPYNGGELIDVYRSVRNNSSTDIDASIRSLYLHNYEDVLGMLAMTPVLAYNLAVQSSSPVSARLIDQDGNEIPAFRDDGTSAVTQSERPETEMLDAEAAGLTGSVSSGTSSENKTGSCFLEASYPVGVPVPEDVSTDLGTYRFAIHGDTAVVTIELGRKLMYHFFPNYKDYYYLPEEDTAMHKSVACFVDADHRKKATAKTCYVKKEGLFLPQVDDSHQPVFCSCYKDRRLWFEFSRELFEDQDLFSEYVHSLIRQDK